MSNTSRACESGLVYSFVSNFRTVPDEELDQAVDLAVRFTARLLSPQAWQEALGALQDQTVEALRSWRRWAIHSYYWGALWRGVVSGDPESWGASLADVELIRQHLSWEDRWRVCQLRDTIHLTRFSSSELQVIYQKLERYCWCLYHKRLRIFKFFSVHDAMFSAEDIVVDLMEAGMMSLWCCEEKGYGIAYGVNFAKKSALNHARYLLEKYTFNKRSRFIPDGQGRYTPRVISFDTLFHSPSPITPDNLFSAIRIQLGSQYERYARAVLGYDPEFDEWVMTSCKVRQKPRRQYPNQSRMISKLAQKWVGLPMSKLTHDNLQKDLAPLLLERMRERETAAYC